MSQTPRNKKHFKKTAARPHRTTAHSHAFNRNHPISKMRKARRDVRTMRDVSDGAVPKRARVSVVRGPLRQVSIFRDKTFSCLNLAIKKHDFARLAHVSLDLKST